MFDFFRRWRVGRMCLVLVAAVAVGTLAMIAAYALPTGPMLHHAQKSASIYEVEGVYYTWAPGKQSAAIDNWTNALIVRSAIFPGSGDVVRDAMLNPSLRYQSQHEVEDLLHQLHGDVPVFVQPYSHYWHGYLVVLKPLRALMSLSYLRMLNLLVQVCLTAYLLLLLGRQLGVRVAAAYFLAYLLLNPVSLAMSFQFTPVYYIAAGLTIFVLRRPAWLAERRRYVELFLLAGILTAFFDLLTYPFVTLGIPLAAFFMMRVQAGALALREGWRMLAASFVSWGTGYGGMYIGKWVAGWLLTGVNIPFGAMQEGLYRMSSHTREGEGAHAFNALTVSLKNVMIPLHEPIGIVLIVCAAAGLWCLWRHGAAARLAERRTLCWLLGAVALLPFVWYFALTNHSYVHAWMSYRELAISVFALGGLLGLLLPGCRQGGGKEGDGDA